MSHPFRFVFCLKKKLGTRNGTEGLNRPEIGIRKGKRNPKRETEIPDIHYRYVYEK